MYINYYFPIFESKKVILMGSQNNVQPLRFLNPPLTLELIAVSFYGVRLNVLVFF